MAVIVAVLTSSVLFVVAAMAVDLGQALARRQIMQDVADIAALAGAAGLPDAATAQQAAVLSLCAQVSDQPELYGWPESTCSDTSWATDGDPDNGEITVFGPDGNGNGFRDDGEAVVVAGTTVRDGSTSDERLAAASSLPGSAIRVVPPPSHVTFHFATAVGIQGVDVDRAATAATGAPSALGTPPFYLLEADPVFVSNPSSSVCIRFVSSTDDLPARCRTPAAYRGFLDEPRNTAPSGSASQAQLNVALGLDHAVAPWTQLPAPPNDPPSPSPCASQSGITLAGAGQLAVNCLSVSRPSPSADLEAGFFGSTVGCGAPTRARATGTPVASTTTTRASTTTACSRTPS